MTKMIWHLKDFKDMLVASILQTAQSLQALSIMLTKVADIILCIIPHSINQQQRDIPKSIPPKKWATLEIMSLQKTGKSKTKQSQNTIGTALKWFWAPKWANLPTLWALHQAKSFNVLHQPQSVICQMHLTN